MVTLEDTGAAELVNASALLWGSAPLSQEPDTQNGSADSIRPKLLVLKPAGHSDCSDVPSVVRAAWASPFAAARWNENMFLPLAYLSGGHCLLECHGRLQTVGIVVGKCIFSRFALQECAQPFVTSVGQQSQVFYRQAIVRSC